MHLVSFKFICFDHIKIRSVQMSLKLFHCFLRGGSIARKLCIVGVDAHKSLRTGEVGIANSCKGANAQKKARILRAKSLGSIKPIKSIITVSISFYGHFYHPTAYPEEAHAPTISQSFRWKLAMVFPTDGSGSTTGYLHLWTSGIIETAVDKECP